MHLSISYWTTNSDNDASTMSLLTRWRNILGGNCPGEVLVIGVVVAGGEGGSASGGGGG